MTRAELGQKGERIAAQYYINEGYTLLAHNYRTRMGELDLILRKGSLVVVCEVKTRTSAYKAPPAAAVDYHKQQRFVRAAQRYLQLSHQSECNVRFDVVEVTPRADGKWDVHCIKQAFEC